MELQKRDLGMMVILTIVTLGIYQIYWMYRITEEINDEETPSDWNTSGFMVVILTIITFFIYSIYWGYKVGQKMNKTESDSKPLVYALLMLLSSPIGMVLIQDKINNILDGREIVITDYNRMYAKYGCFYRNLEQQK